MKIVHRNAHLLWRGGEQHVLYRTVCWHRPCGFEICVFSSYLEGLGTAILDAMALGRPVVATHAGGIPEAVQDRIKGLLVLKHDPQALAEALCSLLRHPEQGQAMGMVGRQRVEQQCTAERMACHTLQVYERVLADASA